MHQQEKKEDGWMFRGKWKDKLRTLNERPIRNVTLFYTILPVAAGSLPTGCRAINR